VDWYLTTSARDTARRAMASGWMINGPEVAALEQEFAAHVGARWAVAVSSGASALELAMDSLGLPFGSRVLLSALSSVVAAQAVVQAGHRPALVDVSPVTGMPTPDIVRAAARVAAASGQPVRAMVVAHPAGDPVDVVSLAQAAGLPSGRIVEDATEGLGGSLGESPVGAVGTVCFSFYFSTNLPVGQGGMVTTDSSRTAERIRTARALHRSSRHRVPYPPHDGAVNVREGGLAASLTDLDAATARGQLAHLDDWQRRRNLLAERYDARLAELAFVLRPHRPAPGTGQHAWHHYPVRIEDGAVDREVVTRALAEAGIRTAERLVPLHRISHVRDLCTVPSTGLAGADGLVAQLVSLPVYPRLPNDAADRVGAVLASLPGTHPEGEDTSS
jgi:perosamine synthetase